MLATKQRRISGLALAVVLLASLLVSLFGTGVAQAATNLPANLDRQEVVMDLGDGVTTRGEFDFPRFSKGPFPAVLLIQGSGPLDRDEGAPNPDGTIGRGFDDIAAQLNLWGVAVFRYDKRGVCHTPTGGSICSEADLEIYANKTREQLISDAKIAYATMISNPRIDAQRTGLFGHSEGTFIAPAVVAAYPDIKTVIMMGTAYSIPEAFTYQRLTIPLAGFTLYDTNKDGFIDKSEIPTDQTELAAFNIITRFGVYLFSWTGTGEDIQPSGLNPRVDTNNDGKFSLAGEITSMLEDFNNTKFASTLDTALAPYIKYADPILYGVIQQVLTINIGVELKWTASYGSDSDDQQLKNILAMPNHPPVLIVNGLNDNLTPLPSVTKLIAALQQANYPAQAKLYEGLSHFLSPVSSIFSPIFDYQPDPAPLGDIGAWGAFRFTGRDLAARFPTITNLPVEPAANPSAVKEQAKALANSMTLLEIVELSYRN